MHCCCSITQHKRFLHGEEYWDWVFLNRWNIIRKSLGSTTAKLAIRYWICSLAHSGDKKKVSVQKRRDCNISGTTYWYLYLGNLFSAKAFLFLEEEAKKHQENNQNQKPLPRPQSPQIVSLSLFVLPCYEVRSSIRNELHPDYEPTWETATYDSFHFYSYLDWNTASSGPWGHMKSMK